MDISWIDRLSLFRYALLSAATAGLICPVLGNLLFLRRTSFYGIALPQFAAAGTVLGFVVLPWWISHVGVGDLTVEAAFADSHAALNYHFAWAASATFVGVVLLVWWGRGRGSEVGRVAAAFAGATAATYVLGRLSPVGKAFVDALLQGEVLGIGQHECEVLIGGLVGVLALLLAFRRPLLLTSFDREFARTTGLHVLAYETLLNVLTGLTIAVGTITLGPTLLFGLLVVPPLVARKWANSMSTMWLLAPLVGLASVIGGTVAAFELDLPLGAAVVATSVLLLIPGALLRR